MMMYLVSGDDDHDDVFGFWRENLRNSIGLKTWQSNSLGIHDEPTMMIQKPWGFLTEFDHHVQITMNS